MMANANATNPTADFATWYSTVDLNDGNHEKRRNARWGAITTIASSLTTYDDIEALIRLAFNTTRHAPATDTLQRFRAAFKATDDAFELSSNNRELQILAAATLNELMNRNQEPGAIAALAIAIGGARTADLPFDLPLLAEAAIHRIGQAFRTRPSLRPKQSDAPPTIDQAEIAQIKDGANIEVVARALTMIATSAQAGLTQLSQRHTDALRLVDAFLQTQDEELDMLWWLIGKHSFEMDCSFDHVPQDRKSFVFAKELADRTKRSAGPPSISPLLLRAGLKNSKEFSLTSVVNAADDGWVDVSVAKANPSPVTMPLHFALTRRRETGAGEAWIAGYAATTMIPENFATSQLTFAISFYRERLLLAAKPNKSA